MANDGAPLGMAVPDIRGNNRNPRPRSRWDRLAREGARHGQRGSHRAEEEKRRGGGESLGQLRGMEPHLDKSGAPGEWTTRQVLCHLLDDPNWQPVAVLQSFASSKLPVIQIYRGTPWSRPSDRI